MNIPKISIIILNWNGKEDTLECLESLRKLDYLNYEIIVVDNGSSDDSVPILRKGFPNIELIVNDKNLGYAGGNNVGIEYALKRKADYIFLLNNDTVVHKDCLRELLDVIEREPKVGFVGPKTYYYQEPKRIQFIGGSYSFITGRSSYIGSGEIDHGQHDELREVDFINGHALLVRKEVIDSIGMLDPEYFAYNEETDWCIRAKGKNYKCLYVPRAIVWHKSSKSSCGLTRPYLITRNQLLFMRKNASKRQLMIFFLHFFLVQTTHRMLSFLKHRQWDKLRVFVQAVGWNFGLWKDNNPLTQMLREK